VYGPEVNQKSRLASTAAESSSFPKTLPVTGIGVMPGRKGCAGCRTAIASDTASSVILLKFDTLIPHP